MLNPLFGVAESRAIEPPLQENVTVPPTRVKVLEEDAAGLELVAGDGVDSCSFSGEEEGLEVAAGAGSCSVSAGSFSFRSSV